MSEEPREETAGTNWVYMMRCGNGSLYTGWTNDLAARVQAHKTGRGAKYTRAFGAVALAYAETLPTKSAALRREAEVKRLPKAKKEELCALWQEAEKENPSEWN